MELKEKEESKTQISTSSSKYLEEFMNLFAQMLNQIKYNLQSFNNKCDSMDKCFNNVLLLKSNRPFDEEENHEEEVQKQIDNFYSEDNHNNTNGQKKHSKKKNKENLKITSKELNNIGKMFEDINSNNKKNDFLEKKRKPGRAPSKYLDEIEIILNRGKIKDVKNKNNIKKNKKNDSNIVKTFSFEEEEDDDDDDQFIDHIILDKKIEKYTQFKEMLKKFEENKKDDDGISDYENFDDELDLDFEE